MSSARKPKSDQPQPIVFKPKTKPAAAPYEPDIKFDDLSAVDKQAMLDALRQTVQKAHALEEGGTDVAPLLKNLEAIISGKASPASIIDPFANKLEMAKANLQDTIAEIEPSLYPPCDARMTIKLPASAKKHLATKALRQDMTLSQYVIMALNVIGELEGDEKIVLVAPPGNFLKQASRNKKG